MKTLIAFLRGLLILSVIILILVGIPTLFGYLIAILNFPAWLAEYATTWEHNTFSTYLNMGWYAIFIILVILILILGIKSLGSL